MKKILLVLPALILFINGYCQHVSIKDAKKVAENVIIERIYPLTGKNTDYIISGYNIKKYNDREVFYIFNLNPKGFIIISSDKSVEPLIAFSYESNYYPDELHPAASLWLESYSRQIEHSMNNKLTASAATVSKWDHLLRDKKDFEIKSDITSMEPMLKTQWNQERYYNSQCPEDPAGSNGRAVTGCVATALGQLLNYFRYPEKGTGSYGYDHPVYGHLEVDFSQQTYDYDQMAVSLTAENEEVAKLLYNIGVSVDMEYGPKSSGMTNHKGAYTLKTYFGYDPETKYLFKDSLPDDFDWNGTLIDHLNRKIPLYYAGWADYEFISGHGFIIDGYSDETHFHFNWGWGGYLDGYYAIDNLTPGGADFTLLHEVIVNAVPQTSLTNCKELKVTNSIEGIIEDGSGPLSNYNTDLECSWLISPQDSVSEINLEFLKFDVADSDFITIYSGDSENSPVLAQIYGDESPTLLKSPSDRVLIKFTVNSDEQKDGWLISYKSTLPEFCKNLTILDASEGTISDGSNGYLYKNNSNCIWRIAPPDTKNIKITFLEFDLEEDKDFLKIYDSNPTLISTLSGSELPESIIIEGERAIINFTSNNSVRKNGFKLFYETNVHTNINTTGSNAIASIYPNPAKDKIFINMENINGQTNIKIISNDGKLYKENSINPEKNSIYELNVSDMPAGMYHIIITNLNYDEKLRFVKE